MRGEIKQARRGGVKGHLDTTEKRLFFILFYLKTYPTFDVLGFHFGLSGGHAHTHVDQLSAVLRRTLSDLNVLPESAVIGPGDFHKLIENYKDIAIDGVECACVRPQDEEEQERCYSGKKKHTLEALVVANFQKMILLSCAVVVGSTHDYALMKEIFKPGLKWFKNTCVWVDLGFAGVNKDYAGSTIYLPHKKPRKSKKNPDVALTAEQKEYNKKHSSTRVVVEHAIGGMKRFHCLVHRIRNHSNTLINSFFLLSAGLWNHKISFNTII